jgi:hypothetical protein
MNAIGWPAAITASNGDGSSPFCATAAIASGAGPYAAC